MMMEHGILRTRPGTAMIWLCDFTHLAEEDKLWVSNDGYMFVGGKKGER
jgi:hypothetical protein